MAASRPRITVTLALDPPSYSFTSPTAPTLSLSFTSHASKPLTIFTFNSPFNPSTALSQGQFPITDLTSTPPIPVPQNTIRVQRKPFSRARGSGDEKYFLTLDPEKPFTVGIGFTRGGGGGNTGRPQPKEVVERGREIDDETGRELTSRRSKKGSGVDGLERGKRYRVDVSKDAWAHLSWRWGTREDAMVDPGSREWNLFEIDWNKEGLDIGEVEGVEFEVLQEE